MTQMRLSLTPYNYVQNNPLNRIDPTGMLDGDKKEEDEERSIQQQQGATVLTNMANSMAEFIENLSSAIVAGTKQATKDGVKLAKEVAKTGVKTIAWVADIVSDGATGVAIFSLVLASFTDGASLTLTAKAFQA